MTFKPLLVAATILYGASASAQVSRDDTTKKFITNQMLGVNVLAYKIAQTPAKSYFSYKTLAQLYQSSVTTGANGGFDFKSSLFGIKKVFASDTLNNYFKAHRADRNLEFTLGVHKNSSGDVSTLTGGIKYALINNRSKSDRTFIQDTAFAAAFMNRLDVDNAVNQYYMAQIEKISNLAKRKEALATFHKQHEKFNQSHDYKDLPSDWTNLVQDLIKKGNPGVEAADFLSMPEKMYDDAAKRIDQRGVLTISFNPGYDYNHKSFDTTSFTIDYVKGFGKNADLPYNFNATGQLLSLRDTLVKTSNLKRAEIVGKIGVTKTFIQDKDANPLLEAALQLEDDWHMGTPLYNKEENNAFSLNTVFTVHLSDQLSLPVTLKYDLRKPNLFGIFNLTWNFETKNGSSSDSK